MSKTTANSTSANETPSNKTASREWMPDQGVIERSTLQRSWKRGGASNAYDFTFPFEGSTVYGRYPQDFDAIEARQNELAQAALQIELDATTLSDLEKADPQSDVSSQYEALTTRSEDIEQQSIRFAYDVVQACVVGWKDAPEPYSDAARAEIPLELAGLWLEPIINKSRLSKSERDFLAKP